MPDKSSKNNEVSYRETYEAALEELSELMSERESLDIQREKVDGRIARLRYAVTGLGGLCNLSSVEIVMAHPELFPDRVTPDVGFTDAIRAVFKGNPEVVFSPVAVRNALEANGFDIKKYKNVLASIHSILKRLKSKNDLSEGNQEGRAIYWLNPKGELAKSADPDDVPF
jgi:hypothetical protein